MMHQTAFLVFLILSLSTIAGIYSTADVTSGDNYFSDNPGSIRLGSFNVHLGMSRKFDFDVESMTQEIKDYDVDLLCMQEVGASNWVMGGIDILDYFSYHLNLPHGTYGSSQIAPAGFNVAFLSKHGFKNKTLYHLPNTVYQSNAVVLEFDKSKFNTEEDIAIMCVHFATGNDKADQVAAVTKIANDYTERDMAFAVIGDWNIDQHTRCNYSCENNWDMCNCLLKYTIDAQLNEYFYASVDFNKTELSERRTGTKYDKLLDTGYFNGYFDVRNATIVEREECYDSCCEFGSADEFVFTYGNNDTIEKCRLCTTNALCKSCSASDHLGIVIDLMELDNYTFNIPPDAYQDFPCNYTG